MGTVAYEVNHRILDVIDNLMIAFGVDSRAQAIAKALCLAKVVVEYADKNGILTIIGKDGDLLKIDLRN